MWDLFRILGREFSEPKAYNEPRPVGRSRGIACPAKIRFIIGEQWRNVCRGSATEKTMIITKSLGMAALRFTGLAVAYWLCVMLSVKLVFSTDNIALFWPANAVAVAVLIFVRREEWPFLLCGIAAAFFFARLPGVLPSHIYIGFCLANIVEVLMVASIVRYRVGVPTGDTMVEAVSWVMIASIAGSLVSAAIGGSFVIFGIDGAEFGESFVGWFASDLCGLLLVLPLLITWVPNANCLKRHLAITRECIGGVLLIVSLLCFIGTILIVSNKSRHLFVLFPYFIFPALVWIGVRHDLRFSALAIFAVGVFAVSMTYLGHGPFVTGDLDPFSEVAVMEGGLVVLSITVLSLGIAIAGRQRAESEALKYAEQLAAILHTVMDGFMIVDRHGEILDVNESLWEMLGYSRDALVGTSITELGGENGDRAIGKRLGDVLSRGRLRFETKCGRRDGALINVEVSAYFRDIDGGRFFIFVKNISTQKEMVEKLMEERRRLADVIWGTNIGIWEWDIQSGRIEVNERCAGMIGFDLKEIEPIDTGSWSQLIHPEDHEKSSATLKKVLAGELDFYECQIRMRHKDGRWVWVLDRGKITAWGKDGEALKMAGTHQDITMHKRMEEHLLQAQKMQMAGQLASGTAHDFNNLLQVIRSNLDLIDQQAGDDDNIMRFVMAAGGAVGRGARLTEQLLAYSRRQTLLPEPTDIGRLMKETASLLKSPLGEGVSITTHLADDCPVAMVDPNGLTNAVVNIALNSRAAMPKGGRLTIATKRRKIVDGEIPIDDGKLDAGDYAAIIISDTGSGMNQNVLRRVFEPFFTTRPVGRGSGLGLSMVYGFVRQSNGYVSIESMEGKGTTVTMLFPGTDLEAVESEHQRREVLRADGVGCVLVVEDDEGVRSSVKIIFEIMGYAVHEAGTAAEALKILDEYNDIDLLFSDVVMPNGTSGLDLAREVSTKYPAVKILLTSGYSEEVIEEIGSAGDVFALIDKPYTMDRLQKMVDGILRDEA